MRLDWSDIIIDDFTQEETESWLSEWDWLLSESVSPIFMTKFGDWFLQTRSGSVLLLDVLEGGISEIAETTQEFRALVNTPEFQEHRLLSLNIFNLHTDGKIPGPKQCYALAPHPALSGKVDTDSAIIMDITVWQSICSQILKQST